MNPLSENQQMSLLAGLIGLTVLMLHMENLPVRQRVMAILTGVIFSFISPGLFYLLVELTGWPAGIGDWPPLVVQSVSGLLGFFSGLLSLGFVVWILNNQGDLLNGAWRFFTGRRSGRD